MQAMPRPAPRVAPATTATDPSSGRFAAVMAVMAVIINEQSFIEEMNMTRKEFLKITSLAAGTAIGSTVGVGSESSVMTAGPADRAEPPSADRSGNVQFDQATKSFPSGFTNAIVAFIAQTSFEHFPEKAIVEARRCLIDGFG